MAIKTLEYESKFFKSRDEFIKKYWKKERLKHVDYLAWKFRSPSSELIDGLILAIDDDKVIGQYGYIPVEIVMDGITYPSQWACDAMVDLEYRGKGVANQINHHAFGKKPITLGSDPSHAATKSYQKTGAHFMEGPWKVSYMKNLYELARIKKKEKPFMKWIPNPFYYFDYFLSILKPPQFEIITPEEYATLYHASKSPHFIYNKLTSDFLEWRFNSFKHYYSGVTAYKHPNGDYYCGFLSKSVYYICDYQAKTHQGLLAIIQHIFKTHTFKAVDMIRLMMNISKRPDWMRFRGFIPFRTVTNIVYFTEDQKILDSMKEKRFYYGYLDSDENI